MPNNLGIFNSMKQKNAVYTQLLDRAGCGPFDGACLVFAQALQSLYGGEIWMITGWMNGGPEAAQHAVLRLPNGLYADAGGVANEREMLMRFQETEGLDELVVGSIRPMAEGDLVETVRDEALVATIALLLQNRKRTQ